MSWFTVLNRNILSIFITNLLNCFCYFIESKVLVSSYIKSLSIIFCQQPIKRFHIIFDIRECSCLLTIPIDKDRLTIKSLSNKDSDYITVLIPDILIDTENIMWSYDVIT